MNTIKILFPLNFWKKTNCYFLILKAYVKNFVTSGSFAIAFKSMDSTRNWHSRVRICQMYSTRKIPCDLSSSAHLLNATTYSEPIDALVSSRSIHGFAWIATWKPINKRRPLNRAKSFLLFLFLCQINTAFFSSVASKWNRSIWLTWRNRLVTKTGIVNLFLG